MKWLPPEDAQYWVGTVTLVVPAISYFLTKFFSAIDEPEGLTQYKARLNRDLKHQKKLLKDKNIPDEVKQGVRQAYTATMVALSTANQHYTPQGAVLENRP